ncbi:MAG: hypothetical protein QOE70_1736 [Chthoniobacter sp.]|jgi:hypothetical protein|nr:hypothetical protein [Chthoniobacter sp.]
MTAENAPWVACLEAADADAFAALRLRPGLEIANLAHVFWLRGPEVDESLALALRQISDLRHFTVLPGGQLLPRGARVPQGRLPELRWQPLREALPVRLPPALGGAPVPPRTDLALEPSTAGQPAGALLAGVSAWLAFATSAAEFRLHSLRFAAARDGRVWIEGTPVPAIAGRRFHLRAGVAAPCGWTWSPTVAPLVVRRWLGLAEGDIAFAHEDGRWEILKAEQFVAATRGAARLTAGGLAHE